MGNDFAEAENIELRLEFLKNLRCVAVVCNQWGDTGKGKFTDLIAAYWADVIIRGTGGANAGHTISINGVESVFHLIPSGILHDGAGKINMLGRGVAFDPLVLINELNALKESGIHVNNLKISHDAGVMLPFHLLFDRISSDNKQKIGTTGRGVGPFYSDYAARKLLFVNDMFNPVDFERKLLRLLEIKRVLLNALDPAVAEEVMHQPELGYGKFYHRDNIVDVNKIIEFYTGEYADTIGRFVADTTALANRFLREGKTILLEGAQGFGLSVDYGPPPYQTSSDPSLEGLAKGCGLSVNDIEYVFAIAKMLTTRVGGGPFPTELGGRESESYCKKGVREYEIRELSNMLNISDTKLRDMKLNVVIDKVSKLGGLSDIELGKILRIKSNEYGATTKRPRRIGHFDLVALKSAMKINRNRLTLTKFDALTGLPDIKICTKYVYQGPDRFFPDSASADCGLKLYKKGDEITEFPRNSEMLYNCKPVYETFPGWEDDISGIKNYDDLPPQVKDIVNFIENGTGGYVDIISVGPDRNQTIIRPEIFGSLDIEKDKHRTLSNLVVKKNEEGNKVGTGQEKGSSRPIIKVGR